MNITKEQLALKFHETYERLAPEFGYETRSDTKKFDPEFKYIRQWVPEFGSPQYPTPMVEHVFARERCLATYKKALAE